LFIKDLFKTDKNSEINHPDNKIEGGKEKHNQLIALLNEIKTIKKKMQNIVIHLNQKNLDNKNNENDYVEALITETKNNLRYFSDLAESTFENILNMNKNNVGTQNHQMHNSSNKENISTYENNLEKNPEQDFENKNLRKNILKIYQFENEETFEDELFQNNYNSMRKPKKKCDSDLMKELTVFLDRNKPKIDTEIIDFSSKSNSEKSKNQEKLSSFQSSKIKLNLNDFLLPKIKNSEFLKENE